MANSDEYTYTTVEIDEEMAAYITQIADLLDVSEDEAIEIVLIEYLQAKGEEMENEDTSR